MSDTALIVSDQPKLPVFSFNAEADAMKERALVAAALIGPVKNADDNTKAVRAQQELKSLINLCERVRKRVKEPVLEAGRQLDATVGAFVFELEKEEGRIANHVGEFQRAEQRRVREEEEIQRKRLAEIEAQRQAELKRIEDERLAKEREAKVAAEAAERAAREARTKREREEAARKAAEAEAAHKEAAKANAVAQEQVIQVQDRADAASYAESRPVEATRAAGQVVSTDWDIEIIDAFELARMHPDCVKIEPRISEIKARLNRGDTLKGISAKRKTTATVRAGKRPALIEA